MPFEQIFEAKIKLELKQHYSASAVMGDATAVNLVEGVDKAADTGHQSPTLNNEMEP